jgi:nitrogen-specific signal transduction histidine kinase
MTSNSGGSKRSEVDELEIRRRVKEMRDEELVDFVRDTITRLDALADRLEVFADKADDTGRTRDA